MDSRRLIQRVALMMILSRAAFAVPTPEQDTLQLSKLLKPIPDDVWSSIAGARMNESYEIARGDTLYDISKRLFGDARYWPKVWAVNNEHITNPHLIRPGNNVAFNPGTGSTLPTLAIEPAPGELPSSPEGLKVADSSGDPSPAAASDAPKNYRRSNEWKRMPRQSWEHRSTTLSVNVDKHGFDKRSIVRRHAATGRDLKKIAASDEMPMLGQIVGSRSAAENLTIGDLAFIQTDGELQVGDTYAITGEPDTISHSESDRTGLSYLILGRLKIIGVKDGKFVGRITNAVSPFKRGSHLIALPSRVPDMKPLAGPRVVTGHLILDREFSTFYSAQHKDVFIDRGSEDGVEPGMIFRAHQQEDPVTKEALTQSGFVTDADIQVLQVSERFSLGTIISSQRTIEDGTSVTLLTDVSDIGVRRKAVEKDLDHAVHDRELDELDRVDASGPGLGKEEEKELKQLEDFGKKKKEAPLAEPELDAPAVESEAPLEAPAAEAAPENDPELDGPAPAPEPAPAPGDAKNPPADADALDTTGLDDPITMPSDTELEQSTSGNPAPPPAAAPPVSPPDSGDAELDGLLPPE